MSVLETLELQQKSAQGQVQNADCCSNLFCLTFVEPSSEIIDLFKRCHFLDICWEKPEQQNRMSRKSQYCVMQVKNCVMHIYTQVKVHNAREKKYFFFHHLFPHLKCYTCFEAGICKILGRRIKDIFNQRSSKSQYCVK